MGVVLITNTRLKYMPDDKILKEFEEMFDLRKEDTQEDESVQTEEYGVSSVSNENFDLLVEEISEEIKNLSNDNTSFNPENPHDIIKKVCSDDGSRYISKIKNDEKIEDVLSIEMKVEEDDFDKLPEIDKPFIESIKEVENNNFEEKVEINNNICEKDIIKNDEDEVNNEEDIKDKIGSANEIKIVNDKIQWSLKSSSEMYDNFYIQKRIFVEQYIIGGQIEYSKWNKELEESQVDIITEVFDPNVIIEQMEEIQQYRNRVAYIGVRVNNQYFLFDRFIDLLRGYLARIQYLKPVLKQDGLILEHMGDIELYFTRLKALYNSVSDVGNNLAAAYEMLSRKVTICTGVPPAERYEKPNCNSHKSKIHFSDKKEAKDNNDYDILPSNAESGPKSVKVGKIGWDNF